MSAEDRALRLAGTVVFANHAMLRGRISAFILAGGETVDWQDVTELDSSALSLIFHARRLAEARGRSVRHTHLPSTLDALAGLYGVRDLIAS